MVNATFRDLQGLSSDPVISSCTAGGGHAMLRMPCCDATKAYRRAQLYDSVVSYRSTLAGAVNIEVSASWSLTGAYPQSLPSLVLRFEYDLT